MAHTLIYKFSSTNTLEKCKWKHSDIWTYSWNYNEYESYCNRLIQVVGVEIQVPQCCLKRQDFPTCSLILGQPEQKKGNLSSNDTVVAFLKSQCI